MTITFFCPRCGQQITAPETLAGQSRKCPSCRTLVEVPTVAAAEGTGALSNQESAATDHPLLLFTKSSAHHGNLIDMTAMVDIVFFLLIFFLVTSMESLEAVINLPTPETSTGASSNLQTIAEDENDPDLVVVMIEADDTVWVEDEEAFSEEDLRAKLRAAMQSGDRDGMLIKGSGDATHGKFVMALDAGADAKMSEILFSVEETEEEMNGE
jgi:biopolymer transport protein ExbD